MVTSCTEKPLCSLVLQGLFPPDSAAWTPEGRGGPTTLPTLLVQSAHVATAKHWPPGKKLNISRCPSSSAEMLKCGEKEGLSFTSKASSWKKHPTLAWVSGVWSGHQGLDAIKVKRKCLRSVYFTPHLSPALQKILPYTPPQLRGSTAWRKSMESRVMQKGISTWTEMSCLIPQALVLPTMRMLMLKTLIKNNSYSLLHVCTHRGKRQKNDSHMDSE